MRLKFKLRTHHACCMKQLIFLGFIVAIILFEFWSVKYPFPSHQTSNPELSILNYTKYIMIWSNESRTNQTSLQFMTYDGFELTNFTLKWIDVFVFSFKDSVKPFKGARGGTINVSHEIFRNGSSVMQFFSAVPYDYTFWNETIPAIYVRGASTVHISFYAMSISGKAISDFFLFWYDNNSRFLGFYEVNPFRVGPFWSLFNFTVSYIPAEATYMTFRFDNDLPGETIFFSELRIEICHSLLSINSLVNISSSSHITHIFANYLGRRIADLELGSEKPLLIKVLAPVRKLQILVRDPNRIPLSNAKITINSMNGNETFIKSFTAVTDENGTACIHEIPFGNWTLLVEIQGKQFPSIPIKVDASSEMIEVNCFDTVPITLFFIFGLVLSLMIIVQKICRLISNSFRRIIAFICMSTTILLSILSPISSDFMGLVTWATVGYYHFLDLGIMGNFVPVLNLIYRFWILLPIDHPSYPEIMQAWQSWPSISNLSTWLLLMMLKFPFIMAYLSTGYAVYMLSKQYSDTKDLSDLTILLWLANPYLILIGPMFASIDIIVVCLSAFTLLFFRKKEYLIGGLSLFLGVWFKLYPIILLPVIILQVLESLLVKINIFDKTLSMKSYDLVRGFLIALTLIFIFFIPIAVTYTPAPKKDIETILGLVVELPYPSHTVSIIIIIYTLLFSFLITLPNNILSSFSYSEWLLLFLLPYFSFSSWFPQFFLLLLLILILDISSFPRNIIKNTSLVIILTLLATIFIVIRFGFYFFAVEDYPRLTTVSFVTKWWPQVKWERGANAFMMCPIKNSALLKDWANSLYPLFYPYYNQEFYRILEISIRSSVAGLLIYKLIDIIARKIFASKIGNDNC